MNALASYVNGQADIPGQAWKNLNDARNIFRDVRVAWPESLEAHLYEGIALDLLEDHRAAIAHFNFVKDSQSDQSTNIFLRAAYNEAIANLRNLYGIEGINKAIALVDELTGPLTSIEALAKASPVRVLALAVKADAYANLTIQWKKVDDETTQPNSPERLNLVLESCRKQVDSIITLLTDFLRSKPSEKSGWDAAALRQLEWSIENAKGDLALYSVTSRDLYRADPDPRSDRYLSMNEVLLLAKPSDPTMAKIRGEAIARALEAFQRCEQLLPPGVETLTNLGTLWLFRNNDGDRVQASRYLRTAIQLNPNYEYAYLRLAQCAELERDRQGVIAILKSFPNPPSIRTFARMFRAYYVQPKAFIDVAESPSA